MYILSVLALYAQIFWWCSAGIYFANVRQCFMTHLCVLVNKATRWGGKFGIGFYLSIRSRLRDVSKKEWHLAHSFSEADSSNLGPDMEVFSDGTLSSKLRKSAAKEVGVEPSCKQAAQVVLRQGKSGLSRMDTTLPGCCRPLAA